MVQLERERSQVLETRGPGDNERVFAVRTALDGRMRSAGAWLPWGLSRPKGIPPFNTFSLDAQVAALNDHRALKQKPGITDIRGDAALPAAVRKGIEHYVRRYTAESQFMHYPLRYNETGHPVYQRIAPGVSLCYRRMQPNPDGRSEQLDPISALYVNLGAHRAPKLPDNYLRAVNTLARYMPVQDGKRGTVAPGDVVALTEILSATTSVPMAATFGQALDYGDTERCNNQRIELKMHTAINISRLTDLVQAEVVGMPGALFRVNAVHPGAPPDAAIPDIGQVVEFEQIDSHALERVYLGLDAGPDAPDQDTAVHPQTGHFYRRDDSGLLVFDNRAKNYFLGTLMERDTPEASGQLARWRHPFTSDFAPRATKDAIHAAILRHDPIVPFLDEAVENVHHAWFRARAGYANTEAGRAEAAEIAATKQAAAAVADRLRTGLAGNRFEAPHDEALLTSLLAGFLRRPIAVVEADAEGRAADHASQLHDRSWDGVNLSKDPLLQISRGPSGYGVLKQDGVDRLSVPIAVPGHSPRALLQAVVQAGYPQATRAARSADKLAQEVADFVATDYLVLQKALLKQDRALAPPAAAGEASTSGLPAVAQEPTGATGFAVVEAQLQALDAALQAFRARTFGAETVASDAGPSRGPEADSAPSIQDVMKQLADVDTQLSQWQSRLTESAGSAQPETQPETQPEPVQQTQPLQPSWDEAMRSLNADLEALNARLRTPQGPASGAGGSSSVR